MSDDPSAPAAAAPPPPPTIHEAERVPGPFGAVFRGAELDFAGAVARRQAGEDVVVCGDDEDANRLLAGQVEAAVGPRTRAQPPERNAGPQALPHYHQISRNPDGHTFYEINRRKTRKKP
jgi:hypothetical protein